MRPAPLRGDAEEEPVADLIILQIHPTKPTTAVLFRDSLKDLTIAVRDLTVANTDGVPLGTASGLADLGEPFDVSKQQILQHWFDFFGVPVPLPSATAIIETKPPPQHPEYPTPTSFDIVLELKRDAVPIGDHAIDYNVQTVQFEPLPPNQSAYFPLQASAFVALPPADVSGTLTHLDLPADGQPPNFVDLKRAIDQVLSLDPGGTGLEQAAPLTPAQCRLIASEIVWNRKTFPPPVPPRPLGVLYQQPDDPSSDDAQKLAQERQRFEGELTGYHATHDADASRLAGFVFAASAAVVCERLSGATAQAAFPFPVITARTTAIRDTAVVLVDPRAEQQPPQPSQLGFTVPAEYFYALGAMLPPQVTPEQRFDMARSETETRLLSEFLAATDAKSITVPAQGVSPIQTARRLSALGATEGSLITVRLEAPVATLVADWLAYVGPTSTIDVGFWKDEVGNQQVAYLRLVLEVIAENHAPLIGAIEGPLGVASVADLVAVTDEQWRGLLLDPKNISLLPPFTEPGTPKERTETFIRHLRTFFAVPTQVAAPGTQPATGIPILERSITDVLSRFVGAYGGTFAFGGQWDPAVLEAAVEATFPGDSEAQAWLKRALETVDALYRMTNHAPTIPSELQLSVMEALYARGVTDTSGVRALTNDEFREALTGTVAFPFAKVIHDGVGGMGSSQEPEPETFRPINPDGTLTDCVPPPELSPLGPVQYLYELINASAASTCVDPLPAEAGDRLGVLLEQRRGPLGDLHATRANLETPLSLIDLVNESLEALAAGPPGTGGAVYDTASDQLAGHPLRSGIHVSATGDQGAFAHDPETLFAALAQHSSPATPVARPAAYDRLRRDFTSPTLPYAQSLDVCRSYLGFVETSRFSTMRHFRRDITELATDPLHEPADFQRHLWRYPVRFDIAREYLGISDDEYELLYGRDVGAPDGLVLRELFGFQSDEVAGAPWWQVILRLPEFIERTGLTYCQFLELWHAEFVVFSRYGEDKEFPDCQDCCLDDVRIAFTSPEDPRLALRMLAVFIRLWHRLYRRSGPKISFARLRDICDVLHLFNAEAINPDFLRQLAALLMLRDYLDLPWARHGSPPPGSAVGADRTQLLGLWAVPRAGSWEWARDTLLERLEDYAEAHHGRTRRGAEFRKLIADNLGSLARLAGFDLDTPSDTWHARPAATLRFAEVLSKLYASNVTAGELIFLFTADEHLDGDDPFPLPDRNEALDRPLELPDEAGEHGLLALRGRLLDVHVSEEDAEEWSWSRIETALRSEFGYEPVSGQPDALTALGEHFFPSVLERHGRPVDHRARQFPVDLDLGDTDPRIWNTPPGGPFRYDVGAKQLWTELPLVDRLVNEKLSHMRQLRSANPAEQAAVRDLYFAPRALLAPFAAIFDDFTEAADRLVQEKEEHERFAFFRWQFALFHRRCRLIAEHLDQHVAAATGQAVAGYTVAWRVLRSLLADENQAVGSWENDSGTPPEVTWRPLPNGGAFAALLGLLGTGLLGEFRVRDRTVWREVRGPLSAFGPERNEWNAPVITVIPALDLALTAGQQQVAAVRNGFALRAADGEPLGGGQPFSVTWSGVLLVDQPGQYGFHAGAPTPDGEEPDFEAAGEGRWRLTLRRGQRSSTVLNHRWRGEDAPPGRSTPQALRAGAYEIVVEFEQPEPAFTRAEDVRIRHTGFQVKYRGPDSGDRLVALPLTRLFRGVVEGTLADGLQIEGEAKRFLAQRFTSSLRDIRRTYQRAFKAVLLAHRLELSATPLRDEGQSELGYLLDHGDAFTGTAYPRVAPAAFGAHRASLDFDFLPVSDPYLPPVAARDQRVQPSPKRQAAMFDWWERIFDYTVMRGQARRAEEPPAWLLFYEAAERQPDDPAQLLRHLGVDIRHAALVLNYFAKPAMYTIRTPDLEDERWAIRTWQAERWLRDLRHDFFERWIGDAHPALWAADEPGNDDLTRFVQDGCFENGEPRRYVEVKRLNDCLRERARTALLAYLCRMDRVPLPWAVGLHARTPRDLSGLLLQDVEAGVSERASRVEDAILSVQTFVQRARLGLEPAFLVAPDFARVWERRFATFARWVVCKRREVYREDSIEWAELQDARRTEAFRFLENELRRSTLTKPVPGGLEWWPSRRSGQGGELVTLQARELASIRSLKPGPLPEGLELLGTPERDARPSWLAPVIGGGSPEGGRDASPEVSSAATEPLPLWIQSAVRMGARFVRVAAAGTPPASTAFTPRRYPDRPGCCEECGRAHLPVIDEYCFWLQDSRHFDEVGQDPLTGARPDPQPPAPNAEQADPLPPDPTSDWHRTDKLPGLLDWPSKPMVHLYWSRLHNGEFQQPRRSEEGLSIDEHTSTIPQLDFKGRTADSLRFEVTEPQSPPGHEPAGFRFDMASDSAVVLPLVVGPDIPGEKDLPSPLKAYPFFAYFAAGAPLRPSSPFSAALAVAGMLRSHCRFEAALKWYELAFEPLRRDNTWEQCPVEEGSNQRKTTDCCPGEWLVSDDVARNRAVTLRYLETLLQWGDALMCRNSPEETRRAGLTFDTMQTILGPTPARVRGPARETDPSMTLAQFVPSFPPLSRRLLALYDSASDRLALIHHRLTAHRLPSGQLRVLPEILHEDFGRDTRQALMHACQEDDEDCHACCSPYRFTFLVQKALELAAEVRAFGAELLAAYEKGDGERLASLRSMHERQIMRLALEARQNQWRDADWQAQALRKAKAVNLTNLVYYNTLIRNGLNNGETQYQALTNTAMITRAGGNIVQAIGEVMKVIPDLFVGFPCVETQVPIGTKLGGFFESIARIVDTIADIESATASLDLTQAGWQRRADEWVNQAKVLTIEVDQAELQILASERRRDQTLREVNNQERQIEHSIEVQDLLRDKFTNEDLYLFLQQETAALHWQAYSLALQAARQAQLAFNYERGYTRRNFLPDPSWDSLHEGLVAGERLQLALRQMEKAYCDENCREYELTKHVSLRLHFPVQYLLLRKTGRCEIDIPEWMFDLDYPGHYMRRIKNVTVTVPCVVGPYTGVHCRLTLLRCATRVDPGLGRTAALCCPTDDLDDAYRARPNDPRIVERLGATEAIATSGGRADGGLFEISFRDERYLPFEFAGAVSRWLIELPAENTFFDLDTLSDVVMHLNYTAREGGEVLRQAANESAQRHLPGAGLRFVDVRNELPDAWSQFQGAARNERRRRELVIHIGRSMLPFLPGHREVRIHQLELLFVAPDAEPSVHHTLDFLPGHGSEGQRGKKEREEERDRRAVDVPCVASERWPGLFHGIVQLDTSRMGELGTFAFPPTLGHVTEAFLFCRFEADSPERES